MRSEGAPEYDFSSAQRASPPAEPKFLPPELDASIQTPPPCTVDVVQLKTALVNAVTTSLLSSPDFKERHDPTRRFLSKLGEKLALYEPEFILKLALYTRCDLNIRTTANFLLALSASLQPCRPFLKKYFAASIRLPSDWIEVAEIYQAFHDKSLNFGSLPTALRKVMAAKFPEFDAYQLAKYNKDSSKKKKNKKDKASKGKESNSKPAEAKAITKASVSSSGSDSEEESLVASEGEEDEREVERLSFTLKQLVRKIHITEPVEHVMCLLGKKYPEDPEIFRRSRLPGTWEEERAGRRMKLATPETWETQVSSRGNKAAVWEELIDNRKLPFMAMLRNLRNMIIAGVSPKHHRWIMQYRLNDERSVVNSRQFPFRFFSAYEVVGELEKIATGEFQPRRPRKGTKTPRKVKEPPKVDTKLLEQYRSALDNALKIATCYNVKPISGSTLILCNVGSNMARPCTAARGLGKPKQVVEVGVLLGLMCKYSCEHCKLIVYGQSSFAEVELKEGTILHNMEQVMKTASSLNLTANEGIIPSDFLRRKLIERASFDNLVLLTDAMNLEDPQGRDMLNFLSKYRQLVNPDLLFVSVDLSSRSTGVASTIKPPHENDIFLAGYSDQILRFIAERGDSGQLTYIDNIDRAYNLKALQLPSLLSSEAPPTPSLTPDKILLASSPQQVWRTVRVFISSTFRDMHGERDLLTRFVFPELRARAHSRQIHVYEVDLRWGVTEEASRSHKAVEICLGEISRCQYFIGLLGERYGWTQEHYHTPDVPEYDWIKELPTGKSITEIEMRHAALCNPDKAIGKAFFYFRDPSLLEMVPQRHRESFTSEGGDTAKLEQLKSELRESGLEVYDGYPGRWLGVVEEKEMVGGLEDFGQRVLNNLWNAIQKDYPEEDGLTDSFALSSQIHSSYLINKAGSFVGRKALLKQLTEHVVNGERVVMVTGKPGSGKTAFMAAAGVQFSSEHHWTVIPHFIGAAPDSSNIASLLTRLCTAMKRSFGVPLSIPEDYAILVKEWPEFIKASAVSMSRRSKLVILIDGVDLLEDKHNGRAMEWLPEELPEGVAVVLSAVQEGACAGLLQRRPHPPKELVVGALDIWDKAEMVRQKLARHRKTLEESAFNNQMKLLLTKKEAHNPLYLHLACEELRVFGVFEEVSAFLRNIPTTVHNLLQDILARLEGEHGTEILSTSLVLLSLVRSGLKEHELAGILSLYFSEKSQEDSLPPMVISRLLRSLQTFLQPTEQESSELLVLAHKDIEKAVRFRYMRGAASEREKSFHKLLANYFRGEVDPGRRSEFKGNNARAFSELPFHLAEAGEWSALEETVCNVRFIVAKSSHGLSQQLLEAYTPVPSTTQSGAKARDLVKFMQQPSVQECKAFVSRNLHVLSSHPGLALQQALNEPPSSSIAAAAQELLEASPQPLMSWLNKPATEDPCSMTLSGQGGAVACVAVSQDSELFAAGFKNCSVKLFQVSTGREVHSFIGHASGISCVCFVGSHALCSGSHDGNLSLWSIKEGFRIATMKGHTRAVHDCTANQAGKIIASVAWDKSIRTWDGHSGKFQAVLKTPGLHNSPLNCVAFHPEGQLLVVGCWDATLKVWDSFNKKKLKTLKGHKTSVQACAYAPSGRHIVSAALDGEVKIWSTRSASAVGSICGHSRPVNAMAYTPNGQYLATASSDMVVKVWSGGMGKRVRSFGSAEYGIVHCMELVSSSQCVRVGYHDGHVRMFNLQSGAEVFAVKPHDAPIVSIGSQSKLLMSASADGSIKLWTPHSLPKSLLLQGHETAITCAVWERHGFASASEDLTILLWPHQAKDYNKLSSTAKASPVKPLHTLRGHTAKISSIAFSPNGMQMASASHDKSVIIWDTYSHQQLQCLHSCHKDWVNTCTFSGGSSDFLLTGSNDFTLKLWDLKTATAKTTFRGHTSAINSVALSHGCVVSAASDGSVKVWTHKGVELTTLHCHKQTANACLIDVPGQKDSSSTDWADIVADEETDLSSKKAVQLTEIQVLTGSDDGTVGVWKPFIPNEVAALIGHTDRVLSVTSTLNNTLISSAADGSIRLWMPDLSASQASLELLSRAEGHTGAVTSCTLSPSIAVSAGRDGCFIVWALLREGEKHTQLSKLYQVQVCEGALTSLCLTPKPSIVVGRDDGAVSVYSCSEKAYPSEEAVLPSSGLAGALPVSKLLVSPNRKHILAASWANKVIAIGTNRKVAGVMKQHTDWVTDMVAVDDGGNTLAYSIGLDNRLHQWSIPAKASDRQLAAAPSSCGHKLELDSSGERQAAWLLALCSVGEGHLAIADSHGCVTLWNRLSKRAQLTKKLHKKAVSCLVSLGAGSLLTGSEDGTVKVWRVEAEPLDLRQVGQFHCRAGATSLAAVRGDSTGKNELPLLVVGDALGHVTLLQWHH